jgi:hypothetical protein
VSLRRALTAPRARPPIARGIRSGHRLALGIIVLAQRLHRLAGGGPEVTEQHADDDRGDHLCLERLADRLGGHGVSLLKGRDAA